MRASTTVGASCCEPAGWSPQPTASATGEPTRGAPPPPRPRGAARLMAGVRGGSGCEAHSPMSTPAPRSDASACHCPTRCERRGCGGMETGRVAIAGSGQSPRGHRGHRGPGLALKPPAPAGTPERAWWCWGLTSCVSRSLHSKCLASPPSSGTRTTSPTSTPTTSVCCW